MSDCAQFHGLIASWLTIFLRPCSQEAKRVFITGPSLVQRARQLKCVFQRAKSETINAAPGVKSVSGDETDINSAIHSSRKLGYFDTETGAPAIHNLSGKPVGRKTADACSDGIILALETEHLETSHVFGGSADNANSAKATIREVVPKCMNAIQRGIRRAVPSDPGHPHG